MRGAPTTQSPAIEARRYRPLAQWFLGTNGASMDASFAVEVQPNVRELQAP